MKIISNAMLLVNPSIQRVECIPRAMFWLGWEADGFRSQNVFQDIHTLPCLEDFRHSLTASEAQLLVFQSQFCPPNMASGNFVTSTHTLSTVNKYMIVINKKTVNPFTPVYVNRRKKFIKLLIFGLFQRNFATKMVSERSVHFQNKIVHP